MSQGGYDTIKSTAQAHHEVGQMMKIITNDLPPMFSNLNKHGNTLSDPQHWDGPLARKFRNEVWPQASRDLDKIRSSLQDLQQQVVRILTAIDKAGGAYDPRIPQERHAGSGDSSCQTQTRHRPAPAHSIQPN